MRLILLLLAAGAVAPEGERETVAETALAEGLAAMAPAEREMFWAKLRRRVARPPSLVAPAEEVGGRRRRVQAGNYSVGSCLGYPTPPSMQRNADTGVRPVHPPALSLSLARACCLCLCHSLSLCGTHRAPSCVSPLPLLLSVCAAALPLPPLLLQAAVVQSPHSHLRQRVVGGDRRWTWWWRWMTAPISTSWRPTSRRCCWRR